MCAVTQHFFFNGDDLEWLVAAQGALTMLGNAGMCYAAVELSGGGGGGGGERRTPPPAAAAAATSTSKSASWYDFDVENFATVWKDDSDATFAAKIALLSLVVAVVARDASLACGPAFDVNDGGDLVWARAAVAAAMVCAPACLNVAKWDGRGRALSRGVDVDVDVDVDVVGLGGLGFLGGVKVGETEKDAEKA